MKSVYIASFFADKERVKARAAELTEAGIHVTARWFDEKVPHSVLLKHLPEEYHRETAVADLEDIISANVVVLTIPTTDQAYDLTPGQMIRGGRHFESGFQFGLAVAQTIGRIESSDIPRELIVLGKKENVFHYLDGTGVAKRFPTIKIMETWEEVVKYLKGGVMPELKDSGGRQTFETGAVRDTASGKPLFELLPSWSLMAWAWIMESGAKKYAARNWEKGMPMSRYLASAHRHLELYRMGFRDEPHLWQALWNIGGAIHTSILVHIGVYPREFYDMPCHVGNTQPPILGDFELTRVEGVMKNAQKPA